MKSIAKLVLLAAIMGSAIYGCSGGGSTASPSGSNPTVTANPTPQPTGGPRSIAIDPTGKFAYVVNEGSGPTGSISTYTIDTTTGILTCTGNVLAGTFPISVGVGPSGKFAYVANLDSDTVSMYSIDPSTGGLTPIGTASSVEEPDSVVVHPSGKFAYVANYGDELLGRVSGSLSTYKVNGDGTLTSTGKINEALVGTWSVVVDPSGKFAYVANGGGLSNTISMYAIDATTGTLTSLGPLAAIAPGFIAVHPSGKFAYVVNHASNDVSIYTIDPATGALTLIGTIANQI